MQLSHDEILFERKSFPIILVCDHISFQQNIGSLFRISDAFGIEKIIFLGKNTPFSLRKINKTSRNTHIHLPYSRIEKTKDIISFLKNDDYEIISLEITSSSKVLKEIAIPKNKKIALIIGNEINGVSEDLLQISSQIVHIDMFGNNSSMNVAQATSIALYEITSKL